LTGDFEMRQPFERRERMPPGAVSRFRFLMRLETGKNWLDDSRASFVHALIVSKTNAHVT
jgi:hypothetical protein